MTDVVIAGACRTAMGKFLGGLSSLSATDLGAIVVRESLARAGVPVDAVDEVILGNVVSAGLGQAPARQAAIRGGVPPHVPAFTVNKVCGSGLKAVMLAAQAIRAGDAEVVVAGGMESMSRVPYLLDGVRTGYRMGHGQLIDAMVKDGLWDPYEDFHMGLTAELVAEKYGITRAMQDEYAVQSHQRAVAAIQAGRFKEEIVPVEVPQRKKAPIVVDTDESPRADTSMEALARLRPAFKPDGGTVTAGNAPGTNDGAAAVVVLSARKAEELGVRPQARITGHAAAGLEPKWVMLAPREAVRNLTRRCGTRVPDYDLYEVNEAFSAAAIAVGRDLELPADRVNVNGGAVALGHPIGASGTRILVTLLHALRQQGKRTGIATLCLGGGNAVALSVEMTGS